MRSQLLSGNPYVEQVLLDSPRHTSHYITVGTYTEGDPEHAARNLIALLTRNMHSRRVIEDRQWETICVGVSHDEVFTVITVRLGLQFED